MQAGCVCKLPEEITEQHAAALMLPGLTVHYLLHRTYLVQKGDTILIHAAAGDIGLLMCQWAKALGATVIGTVRFDEKAELAAANDCDIPITYKTEDFVAKVTDVTDGASVPVVSTTPSVKDTFAGFLDCLRPLGMMVSFGNASGPPPAINVGELGKRGSLFLTRPSLMNHTTSDADLHAGVEALFKVVTSGLVSAHVNHIYALKNATQAHADLEAYKTTGSIILLPRADWVEMESPDALKRIRGSA